MKVFKEIYKFPVKKMTLLCQNTHKVNFTEAKAKEVPKRLKMEPASSSPSSSIQIQKLFKSSAISSFILLSAFCVSLSSASIAFGGVNEIVEKHLENDRPCNFRLGFQDSHLRTPEIIARYDYPVERHWVTTEDGYILEVLRIPRGPNNTTGQPTPAIFLMHGILSCSRDFVINCDRRALAFELWDNGYDVWLGNYRGTPYGRNHTNLKVEDPRFWDFSLDQIGYYDLPAMVDHVLNITSLRQITYIAHSMGNGVGLIALSTRPEYNAKVNMAFCLAGAVTLQDTGSPVLRIAAAFPRSIEWALRRFNRGELFPPTLLKFVHRYAPTLCRREGRMGDFHGFCSFLNFINDGYDPGQVSPEIWQIASGSYPTSCSAKAVVQWMQWIISGNFAMYDEGPMKNLKKYGTVKPTKFPIEKMTVPAVVFYGENDWLVSGSDVVKTKGIIEKKRLNAEFIKVANPRWNHADFVFGRDADLYVYKEILTRLRALYPGNQSPVNNDDAHEATSTFTVESESESTNNYNDSDSGTDSDDETTTVPTILAERRLHPKIDIRINDSQ